MKNVKILRHVLETAPEEIIVDEFELEFRKSINELLGVELQELEAIDLINTKTTPVVPILRNFYSQYISSLEVLEKHKKEINESNVVIKNYFNHSNLKYTSATEKRDTTYKALFDYFYALQNCYKTQKAKMFRYSSPYSSNESKLVLDPTIAETKMKEFYSKTLELQEEIKLLQKNYNLIISMIHNSYDLEMLKENINRI